jgi:exopolyphosphatase/guanosine-5'-triphosphate,3'-diphosphate pyrophosphatase
LHIGHQVGSQMRIVKSERDPVRLAAGLDKDNVLGDEAFERGLRCLRAFRDILGGFHLSGVRVVATNTLRVARNAAQFLALAEQAIGYPIEVISGEEEGRLIYMGVAHALAKPAERRLVIDIGGGSTEIILGHGPEIKVVESFGVGTQPQCAMFFAGGVIGEASFDAAINQARSRIEDAAAEYPRTAWDAAYGSSGTIRAISEVIARNAIGDGTMSCDSLVALQRRLVEIGHVDRFDLPGVKTERVGTMVGGLSALIGIMQELGIERMTAVDAGVRLGVLCDLEMRANQHDRRDQAIKGCMRRFGVDEQRASRTAAMAGRLYDKLKPESDRYARYLSWSCLLHEIGQAVSHSGAHKHAAYIVENADLPGFTTNEQRLMSTLIVGQKGNLRKIRNALDELDFAKAQLALRLAAMFMHARLDDDLGDLKVRMKGRIDIEVRRDWMKRHPTVAYWLEKEHESWAEVDVPLSVTAV